MALHRHVINLNELQKSHRCTHGCRLPMLGISFCRWSHRMDSVLLFVRRIYLTCLCHIQITVTIPGFSVVFVWCFFHGVSRNPKLYACFLCTLLVIKVNGDLKQQAINSVFVFENPSGTALGIIFPSIFAVKYT